MKKTNSIHEAGRSKLFIRIAWSKKLWWALVACSIWGLFPWLMGNGIAEDAESMFFPYFSARYFFVIIFAFLASFGLFVKDAIVGSTRKSLGKIWGFVWKNWLISLGAGLVIIGSRWFESRAFGKEGKFAGFSMIFSVFFVLLWLWLPWVIKWIRPSNEHGKSLEHDLTIPIYIIQVILVIFSSIFFLYALEGHLNFLESGALKSILFCFAASFCLFWLFELLPDCKNTLEVILFQLIVGVEIYIFSTIFRFCCDWQSLLNSFYSYATITGLDLGTWSNIKMAKFVFGIAIAGTVMAYAFEHIGKNGHDNRKEFGDWKIPGSEWLNILAGVDPIVASICIIILSLFTGNHVNGWWSFAGKKPESSWWLIAPVIGIIGVMFCSILKIWMSKQMEMERECFSCHWSDDGNIKLRERALWMSRFFFFNRSRDFYPNQKGTDSLIVKDDYDFSDLCLMIRNHKDMPRPLKPLLRLVWIQKGGKIYSKASIDSTILLEAHKDWLLSGIDTKILEVNQITKLIEEVDFRRTESKIYTKEKIKQIISEQKKITIGTRDGEEYYRPFFIYTHDVPASSQDMERETSMPEKGKSGEYITVLCKVDNDNHDEIRKNWFARFINLTDRKCYNKEFLVGEQRYGNLLIRLKDFRCVNPDDSIDDIETTWVFCEDSLFFNLSNKSLSGLLNKKLVLFSNDEIRLDALERLGIVPNVPGPYISNLNKNHIGCSSFLNTMDNALVRFEFKPLVVIIDDDGNSRKELKKFLMPSLAGTEPKIILPESEAESRNTLKEKNALVIADFNLYKWRQGLTGSRIIAESETSCGCNPYLISLEWKGGNRKPWGGYNRYIGRDENGLRSAVIQHCGIRRTSIPWIAKYKGIDKLIGDWGGIIMECADEIENGKMKRMCRGYILDYGSKRGK